MLFTPDGKQIKRVPHASDFRAAIQLLGASRAEGVRRALNRIIDEMPPDKETGRRTFNSAQVASQLQPWPYPLAGLYDIALDIEGNDATGRQVYDRAGLIFALFVWECFMARQERWVLQDQGAGPSGPNQEIMGAVYQELGLD
ncbi:MAG: hypothetical protein A2Z08_01365 [Deltaproteobacteria bacterium RBG_16_54_11]|nr:MAG: hypothetical protein A2Z08_01365 [Deltaproteobacteria bacterium RBG_16_54_11]